MYTALTLVSLFIEAFNIYSYILNNYATGTDFSCNKVVTEVFLTHALICYAILTRV